MNNKIQNPKIELDSSIEMNDENYLNDILETEKNMSVNFTYALNEASNETLFNEIIKHVAPGTRIYSDSWRAYRGIDKFEYEHFTVDHSKNFVDPQTKCHTKHIERLWKELKKPMKRYEGTRKENVKRYLDNRYSANSPKRKSIEVPNFEFKNEDDITEDTKEYDINAIIEKAKQGKNIDYTKERLKKVRDTQYEILNNLDLEIKKTSEPLSSQRQQEEENLKNLINTITQLELCNRNSEKEYSKKEISQNLDLLSDLSSNSKENASVDKMEKNDNDDSLEPTVTVTKIDTEKYQKEFADISYNDKSTIIIKIIIFIVILVLIFGAVYIVNNILDLGLFG